MKIREFLTPLVSKDFNIPEAEINDDHIIEFITEAKTVFRDSDVDEHRWYNRVQVVVEPHVNLFVRYNSYQMTGDSGMDDMDLQYDLEQDFWIVEKREVIETVIYYDEVN